MPCFFLFPLCAFVPSLYSLCAFVPFFTAFVPLCLSLLPLCLVFKTERAYKPGSVSLAGGRSFIWEARLPVSSSGLPGTYNGAGYASSPIWPCTGWGLQCPGCRHPGGGLLPRHFNLTPENGGGMFSVALSLTGEPVTGCYPAPCPAVPGLSSPACAGATVRPVPNHITAYNITCIGINSKHHSKGSHSGD